MATPRRAWRWGLLVAGALGLAMGGCASQSTTAGVVQARFDEGMAAYNRGDYTTAMREFLPLARQGDSSAQYNLGVMYTNGWGVPQDYQQALFWYRKAADQGDPAAPAELGVMYQNGLGVPQDYQQALFWYREGGMNRQDAKAKYGLGIMYYRGQGVSQDYQRAALAWRMAANQGLAQAQIALGDLYTLGQGVSQDDTQAYFWISLGVAHSPIGLDRDKAVQARDTFAARLTPAQLASAQAQVRAWHDLIRQVQERLQTLGFSPGAIDGMMGPQTQKALQLFQYNQKALLSTGELNEQTLEALGVR